MTCSVRHNVKETLVGENLVRMEGNELIPVVSEDKLLSRAYTMAQQLLEEYGTEAADLPFIVSENRVILNDELFRMIDGADPETQSSMENELLMSMRHLMRQLGISENVVSVLKDREGNPIQGVAAADLINRSIQYLEGKESELPEEVIHFYVQALKDTSDPLYASMRARITSEPEYKQVTRDYQGLGYTQEDIIDEAIAKVILNRVRPQVKTGVSELFESNPELANIGTQEQYSQYLDTIFPDSKVKDIVYRGGNITKEEFAESEHTPTDYMDLGVGLYLSPSRRFAGEYGNPRATVVNIKNPKDVSIAQQERADYSQKEGNYGIPKLDSNGKYDGIVDLSKKLDTTYELVVFEPEQIHILGSKQDIEGFKAFVQSKQSITPRKGISELFSENPELATIGTQEQYERYLSTIFPDSKVKDIVYHSSNKKVETLTEGFSKEQRSVGFHFYNVPNTIYGEIINPAIINAKNRYIPEGLDEIREIEYLNKEDKKYLKSKGFDYSLIYKNEYVVFEPEQIYILGSKQDIEGFRAFVKQSTTEVKPGVVELFESNPELVSTGTPEQYSQYLNTIFPDSKVKDIVYHGTKGYNKITGEELPKFEKFDKSFIGKGQGLRSDDMAKGFYFGSYKIADRAGTRVIPAILNIQEETNTTVRRNTKDFDTTGDVFVVFEPEQIHILGSKQDIEGFKAFVSKGKSEDTGDRNTRWWNRVLKRLREMFGVGTEKTDPFKEAALEMFRRDLTQYRDVVSSFTRGTILRSVGDTQALIRDSILAQHNKLKQEPIDWKELVGKLDTLLIEQAKEGDGVILRYRTDDGKIITKRATDGHQIEFLRTLKKNRKKSDPKKYEHIRVTGTQLHDSARWIAVKYAEKHSDKFNLPKVTDDKTPGTKELIEKSGLTQEQFKHFAEEVVKIMDDMYRLQQTIDPKGKVDVMPEVTVLDEKSDTAGTIDLLFLFSDGSAAVYDYKFISPGTDALRPDTYLLSKDQFYNKKLEGYENQMGFYLNALNRQYGIPPNKIRRSRLVPGHVRFKFSKGKPERIMYFAMGASKDRYLQQIPVRQEYSAELPKKLLDKLSEIYARLNVLDSVEKKNASQRKETELLNTAVRELLNDSDMRWTLEEIDNALENFRELRKEDKLEEMTSEQIAQDILMLSRYKMVNEAMEYRTLSEASKSKLQNLNAEVESAMMVLDTLFKDRVLKEKGYDLTIASKKSGGVDKLLSLHTHHNQVVAYGMKLMTEAKIEAQEELNQIMDKFDLADEKLKEWGKRNGKSLQDVYDMFIESSKNGLRLVPVLSNEFRELRQEMTDMMLSDDKTEQLKASKWVKEHFRIKEGAKEQFDKDLERYKEVLMNSTPGPKSQRYEDLLKEWLRKRNVWSKESFYAWFLDGKRYLEVTPEKFESSVSQSYKEIMKHPELLEWVTLWKNTMAEMNRRIPHEYIPLSMVPAVPISLGEKVGSDISGMPGYIKEEFKRSFTLETELNERFGEHVKSIPLRYMHAMGSSNGEIDSSMFSRDLRNVMYKFLESALENEKLSQIEGQMLVLRNILASNKVGKMKNGVLDRGPASLENMDPATMEYFDALINSQMYGQKWAQEFTGTLFGVKISAKSVQSMMSLFSKIRMTVPVRAALAAGVAGEGFLRAQMNSNPNFGEKNYQKSLTMLLKDNDRFWALARRFDAISEAQSALVAREKRSLLTSRALDPVYGYYPLIPVDRMLNATAMVTMLHNYAMVNGEAVRLSLLPEGTKSIAEGVEIKDGKLVTEIPLEILKKLIMVHRMEMRGVTGSMSQYDFAAYHNDMMVSVLMQFKGWMPGLAQAHFGGVRYDQLLDRFDEGKIAGSLKAVSSKFNRDEMEGELKLRDLLKKTADTVLDGLHTLVLDSAYTLSSVERDKRIKEGTWDLNSTAEKKYQNRRNRLLAEFEIFRNNTSVPRFRKEGKATESDIEAFMQMRQQSVRGMMTELRNMLGTMLLSSMLTAALMGDDDEATYASKVSNDLLARIILEMAQFYNPIELMKTVKNPIALLGLAELIAKIGSNGVDEMLTLVGVRDGKRDMTPFLHFSRKLLPGFNTYSFFSGD